MIHRRLATTVIGLCRTCSIVRPRLTKGFDTVSIGIVYVVEFATSRVCAMLGCIDSPGQPESPAIDASHANVARGEAGFSGRGVAVATVVVSP